MSNILNLAEIDCIYLSYDEPNAEKNYADLLNKAPWAKRVHGVKGSDAAHKECAKISETDRFITVDADNIVDPKFFEISIDLNRLANGALKQFSWCGKNFINGLAYGNGGLKCWTKDFVLNMKTHEAAEEGRGEVDFCWEDNYTQMAGLHSVVYNNASPLQAWRAGFREGVKLTLERGKKIDNLVDPKKQIIRRNYQRLLVWSSVGADVENGLWAIFGARLGMYMTNCTNWDYVQVRDFEYLNSMFEKDYAGLEEIDIVDRTKELGEQLRLKLNMPVADLDDQQSKFFKEVWVNPPRFDSHVREKDTDWDILDL